MSGQTTAPTLSPAVPAINGKPWYLSKTLWFNGLCAMLAVAEINFKLLEGRIPGGFYTWMAFVLPIGNALLRIITTTALIMPRVEQSAPLPPSAGSQGGFISLGMLGSLLPYVAAFALALGVVYWIQDWGYDRAEAKWQKREAARIAVDQAEAARLAKLGQHAAAHAIEERQREAEREKHLTGVMNHARKQFSLLARSPLLAHAAAGADVRAACGLRQPDRLDAAPGSAPAPEQIVVVPVPVDVGPELTLGAVWLWNAALTGQTSRAEHSCRVDAATGQADPACAQPSGLDLDAAFANQAQNAAACREDRAAHQRLIDYLHSLSPSPLSK